MPRPLEALVNGPVCGQSQRHPRLFHAVPGVTVAKQRRGRTVTALCGVQQLRLVLSEDRERYVLFPPSGDAGKAQRCNACWVILGKPAPRSGRKIGGRRS